MSKAEELNKHVETALKEKAQFDTDRQIAVNQLKSKRELIVRLDFEINTLYEAKSSIESAIKQERAQVLKQIEDRGREIDKKWVDVVAKEAELKRFKNEVEEQMNKYRSSTARAESMQAELRKKLDVLAEVSNIILAKLSEVK